MVRAGVTADRRTDLIGVPGILTGQRYIDEILCPHVVPFLRPMGKKMASSKMTTQGRIGQELSTDFCKLTM